MRTRDFRGAWLMLACLLAAGCRGGEADPEPPPGPPRTDEQWRDLVGRLKTNYRPRQRQERPLSPDTAFWLYPSGNIGRLESDWTGPDDRTTLKHELTSLGARVKGGKVVTSAGKEIYLYDFDPTHDTYVRDQKKEKDRPVNLPLDNNERIEEFKKTYHVIVMYLKWNEWKD